MYAGLVALVFLPIVLGVGEEPSFPEELVTFSAYRGNPVFAGGGSGKWDEAIRERGWILKEGDGYHLWYTGYVKPDSNAKYLGYATSPDGLHWTRHGDAPLISDRWVEDMMVVKKGDIYYMFAEGIDDQAQLLTSTDRVTWRWDGYLDIRYKNGEKLTPGPYGTPTAYCEDDTWYLFYEREDAAIWLASSKDLITWTNVQDEPVLECGPGAYDRGMVALNQVVKHKGRYYAYYHGLVEGSKPEVWTTNMAVSDDLIHWTKYSKNPLVADDKSSGFLVQDGAQYRLYTAHPTVWAYFPVVTPSIPTP